VVLATRRCSRHPFAGDVADGCPCRHAPGGGKSPPAGAYCSRGGWIVITTSSSAIRSSSVISRLESSGDAGTAGARVFGLDSGQLVLDDGHDAEGLARMSSSSAMSLDDFEYSSSILLRSRRPVEPVDVEDGLSLDLGQPNRVIKLLRARSTSADSRIVLMTSSRLSGRS